MGMSTFGQLSGYPLKKEGAGGHEKKKDPKRLSFWHSLTLCSAKTSASLSGKWHGWESEWGECGAGGLAGTGMEKGTVARTEEE